MKYSKEYTVQVKGSRNVDMFDNIVNDIEVTIKYWQFDNSQGPGRDRINAARELCTEFDSAWRVCSFYVTEENLPKVLAIFEDGIRLQDKYTDWLAQPLPIVTMSDPAG